MYTHTYIHTHGLCVCTWNILPFLLWACYILTLSTHSVLTVCSYSLQLRLTVPGASSSLPSAVKSGVLVFMSPLHLCFLLSCSFLVSDPLLPSCRSITVLLPIFPLLIWKRSILFWLLLFSDQPGNVSEGLFWPNFLSLCPKLCLAFLSKEIFTRDPQGQAPASWLLRAGSFDRCCAARRGAFGRRRRRGWGAGAPAATVGHMARERVPRGAPRSELVSLCLLLVQVLRHCSFWHFLSCGCGFISFSWALLVGVCFAV